jgi:ferritin
VKEPTMLSQEMVKKLNDQINLEAYSSNLYLQMSAWCKAKGLDGCGAFLQAHAAEEMMHMHRLFDYVNETGAMAALGRVDAPPTEYASITAVFEHTYKHEVHVTRQINLLVDTALADKDFSTFNFLQWYVAEQHEEERLFKSILDQLGIIGTEGRGLFFFDREIGQIAATRAAAKPQPQA